MIFGSAQKIFPRNFLSTIFLGKVHHEISHENANQVIGFWHSALIFTLSLPLEMRKFIERDRQMFGFELFYHSKMNKTAVVELHRVSVVRIISWNFHESPYKKFLFFLSPWQNILLCNKHLLDYQGKLRLKVKPAQANVSIRKCSK